MATYELLLKTMEVGLSAASGQRSSSIALRCPLSLSLSLSLSSDSMPSGFDPVRNSGRLIAVRLLGCAPCGPNPQGAKFFRVDADCTCMVGVLVSHHIVLGEFALVQHAFMVILRDV